MLTLSPCVTDRSSCLSSVPARLSDRQKVTSRAAARGDRAPQNTKPGLAKARRPPPSPRFVSYPREARNLLIEWFPNPRSCDARSTEIAPGTSAELPQFVASYGVLQEMRL